MRLRFAPLIAAAPLLAPDAAAQSFNVDLGVLTAAPSSTYPAAGAQPGVWNSLANAAAGPLDLVDLSGAPTGVVLTTPPAAPFGGAAACQSGDDEALLGDIFDPLPFGRFTFTGLANGSYTVVTYGLDPQVPSTTTDIDVVGSQEGVRTVGGQSFCTTGGFQENVTHVVHTVAVTNGTLEITYVANNSLLEALNGFQLIEGGTLPLGTRYCNAVPNSTSAPARMSAQGSPFAAENDVTLTAAAMPPGQFGIFVASRTQAQTPVASGNLCLGGTLGRYQGNGQIRQVDANGRFSLQIDTSAIPEGGAAVAAQPGDTWNFTAWFRDTLPSGQTANFADGLELGFL